MTAGVLVLVVGPSGAGKDTLINAARERLAADPRFVFPRRIVTRASTVFEDHGSVSAEQFAHMASTGVFAVHWHAHGLGYALPREIDGKIAAGGIAVCNVSRAVIEAARQRYGNVRVFYIDARPDVRAARIAMRGRDAAAGSRVDPGRADSAREACHVLIDNSDRLDTAIADFMRALSALLPETS